MAQELTDRQREVFDFVCDAIRSEGRPPTVREIADYFEFRSPKAASDHLAALERKGYITRQSGKARNIEVREELSPQGIPVVGKIEAGKPITALENLEGSLNPISLFSISPKTVAVKMTGDSLEAAGIMDGDYVVVEYGERIEDDTIAAVQTAEGPLVRRVSFEGNKVKLAGEGKKAEETMVDRSDEDFHLMGPIKGVVRRL